MKAFVIAAPIMIPNNFANGGYIMGPAGMIISGILIYIGGCLLIDTSLKTGDRSLTSLTNKALGRKTEMIVEFLLFIT
jgi:amino acid permease